MYKLIFPFLLLPVAVFAESIQPDIYQIPNTSELRSSPPTGGFFGFPGQVTGKTTPERPYVVLRDHEVQQGFSKSKWVEVAPVQAEGLIDRDNSGWILLKASDPVQHQLPRYPHALPAEVETIFFKDLNQEIKM